jgi:hypothetical protein
MAIVTSRKACAWACFYDSLSGSMQGRFVVEEMGRSLSPQELIALWCVWQMFGYVSTIEGDFAIDSLAYRFP